MDFSNILIRWYLQHKRELPWRNTSDPYFIWLSEIILQQTRVAQGLPYFLVFTEAFPTVFHLANADEERVLKLWQGLGYYSRARNLHKTAKHVAFDFRGIFPNNYTELLKLQGIGEYTAAAIASFSYNEAVPVVDGNVFRVLSRVFEVETDITSSSARREFTSLAGELIPKDDPAVFNQAIMEFGAMQCIPKSPDCTICPLNYGCLALQKKKVSMLPVKSKKAAAKNRFLNYLVFSDEEGKTLLRKRTGKGIWENLYEFPVIETSEETGMEGIFPKLDTEYEILSVIDFHEKSIVHKLTHQHLHIKFRRVNVKGHIANGITGSEIHNYPVPAVLSDFIQEHF